MKKITFPFRSLYVVNKIIIILFIGMVTVTIPSVFAVLSCSMTTQAGCTGTVVLRLSSESNAHAELPSQTTTNYDSNVICCSGSQTIGTSCAGTSTTFLHLEKVTNSHVQESSQTGYTNNVCMSVVTGTTSSGYGAGNCSGYDTTIASISGVTNATIGSSTAYTTKVCGSESDGIQRMTFSISTNLIYLGVASPVLTRYASSTNTSGSDTEVEAHTFSVKTGATNGYTVTVRGGSLSSGAIIIAPIGNTNTPSSVGTEQFGIRLVASGGSGTTTAPYDGLGFAFAATATSSSRVASASVGDNATTTYSVRYVSNIAPNTQASSYTANIVYVATANF